MGGEAWLPVPEGVKVDGKGAQTVTVNGDTRLDVQLVRR